MRTSILCALLAAGMPMAAPALAAASQAGISGRWATEGFGSIVEFRPCQTTPTERCGRTVWLWSPALEGRPRLDRLNPALTLRSRQLVGIEIVTGLRETSSGVWTGGRLYNPGDGRTYTGTVRLRGGVLELMGCAFNLVCRNQTWRRPQDVLTAAQVR